MRTRSYRSRRYELLATPPLTTRCRTAICSCAHHLNARISFSSSWANAALWNALAIARLFSVVIASTPPAMDKYLSKWECNEAYEKSSLPRVGRGKGSSLSGHRSASGAAQNFSRAAPGPTSVQSSCNILEILSNVLPIASSKVVARMRKDVRELASTMSVCPPETRSVRKGNCGTSGQDVRRGVKACAC